jgi:hypothetical protein
MGIQFHSSNRHHQPPRHGLDHTTETLRAMLRARIIDTAEEMSRAADEIDPSKRAGAFIRANTETVDLGLLLRQLESHIAKEAATQYEIALAYAKSGRVAIVPPVPPHMFHEFGWSDEAVILQFDDHDLPPSVRYSGRFNICSDFPEALRHIDQIDMLVFDAFRTNGGFQIRPSVAALVDKRHLRAEIQLVVHPRRHADFADIEVDPEIAARFVLV